MRPQVLAAAVVAVLATFQITRNTVVQGEDPAQLGSLIWRHHPHVLRAVAMREVGEAAAAGQVPSDNTMEDFRILATNAPLAPDPFLVGAALAVKEGDRSRAERLLLHALRREPRSNAGRFLLADLYLSSGRTAEGLVQLALLTRIMPKSVVPLAGALEQFARSGGTAAQLRQLFVVNPALENQVLSTLASNPANADLIVAAASRRTVEDATAPPAWQEKLLNAMVASGEYQKAYSIWLDLVRMPRPGRQTIFNPRYRIVPAPPPFNWAFTSSAAGVAEGDEGTLHVVHYGSADATLAKQLLVLSPGAYRLSVAVTGTVPSENQLRWSITCLPSHSRILAADISDAGTLRPHFEVPPDGCEAQQIELQGRAQEPVQSADIRVSPIRIERVRR